MATTFKYVALPNALSSDPASVPIIRTSTAELGLPCRRCLREGAPGDKMALFYYDNAITSPDSSDAAPGALDPNSPSRAYRFTGPIFVHVDPAACTPFSHDKMRGQIDSRQLNRIMSVRGFNREGSLAKSVLVDAKGSQEELDRAMEEVFGDEEAGVKYAGLFNAQQGCYAFSAVKIEGCKDIGGWTGHLG